MITLFIAGIPATGGSKKYKGHRRGIPVLVDDCKRNAEWRALVAWTAKIERVPMLEGPLKVDVTFSMPRPKAHYGAKGLKASAPILHTHKPDATKLWRAAEDALTGIAWRDDAQIAEQTVRKIYAEVPGMKIIVSQMGDGK